MPLFDPLSALATLEQRFDGPVQAELRRAVMNFGMEGAAAARSGLFDRLARYAVAALAQSRCGAPQRVAQLTQDLRLYRQAGMAWRDRASARPQG